MKCLDADVISHSRVHSSYRCARPLQRTEKRGRLDFDSTCYRAVSAVSAAACAYASSLQSDTSLAWSARLASRSILGMPEQNRSVRMSRCGGSAAVGTGTVAWGV